MFGFPSQDCPFPILSGGQEQEQVREGVVQPGGEGPTKKITTGTVLYRYGEQIRVDGWKSKGAGSVVTQTFVLLVPPPSLLSSTGAKCKTIYALCSSSSSLLLPVICLFTLCTVEHGSRSEM